VPAEHDLFAYAVQPTPQAPPRAIMPGLQPADAVDKTTPDTQLEAEAPVVQLVAPVATDWVRGRRLMSRGGRRRVAWIFPGKPS